MKIISQYQPYKNLNQNKKNINFTSFESPFDQAPSKDFSDQTKSIQNEKLKQELFECQKELIHYLKIEQKNNPAKKVEIPKPFHEREPLTRWDGYDYERRQILKELKDCKKELVVYRQKYNNNKQCYMTQSVTGYRPAYNRDIYNLPLYACTLRSYVENKPGFPNQNIPDYKNQTVYACCFNSFRKGNACIQVK